MSMYLTAAYVYILLFYFLLTFSSVFRIKAQFIGIKLFFLSLSFATIAYHIYPSPVWDLSRLLSNVVTAEGLSLGSYSEQVSNNGLYIYDLIVMIAAKLNNSHLLPAIIVFITFSSVSFIIILLKSQNNIETSDVLFYTFLFPALSNFENIFSGLRTSCSYAVIAFGIIFFLFSKRKIGKYLVLVLTFLFGIGMHPAVWPYLVLLVLCISKIKLKLLSTILIIWSSFSRIIGLFLIRLPMPFSYIGEKLTHYIGQSIPDMRLLLVSTTFILYLSIQLIVLYKKEHLLQDKRNSMYLRYLTLIVSFALGSFFVFELLNRSMMMIAPLILPLIIIERKFIKSNVYKLIMLGDIFFAALLFLYSSYTFTLYAQIY